MLVQMNLMLLKYITWLLLMIVKCNLQPDWESDIEIVDDEIKLDLSQHGLRSSKGLRNYNYITYLDLSQNYLKFLDDIDYLTKLTYLDLSFNQINSIQRLENLTRLKYLDLGKNNIKNLLAT
jgi:Leucine-rich repeat (LRR) protein